MDKVRSKILGAHHNRLKECMVDGDQLIACTVLVLNGNFKRSWSVSPRKWLNISRPTLLELLQGNKWCCDAKKNVSLPPLASPPLFLCWLITRMVVCLVMGGLVAPFSCFVHGRPKTICWRKLHKRVGWESHRRHVIAAIYLPTRIRDNDPCIGTERTLCRPAPLRGLSKKLTRAKTSQD